jgi:hypothetical protein
MNIDDTRFLFSALLQVLPTALSIAFVAVISIRKERKKLKKCLLPFILLVVLFLAAILFIMLTLFDLSNQYSIFSQIIWFTFGISYASILFLFVFLVSYLKIITNWHWT